MLTTPRKHLHGGVHHDRCWQKPFIAAGTASKKPKASFQSQNAGLCWLHPRHTNYDAQEADSIRAEQTMLIRIGLMGQRKTETAPGPDLAASHSRSRSACSRGLKEGVKGQNPRHDQGIGLSPQSTALEANGMTVPPPTSRETCVLCRSLLRQGLLSGTLFLNSGATLIPGPVDAGCAGKVFVGQVLGDLGHNIGRQRYTCAGTRGQARL